MFYFKDLLKERLFRSSFSSLVYNIYCGPVRPSIQLKGTEAQFQNTREYNGWLPTLALLEASCID